MNRNRYLFNKQGDCYLPAEDLTLVELTKEGEHFFLGACTDPQVNLMSPAQVVSKVPVNVAKLHAERDALLVALEQVESLAHSAGSMERYVSWNKVYKIARAAIAKAKGGE